MNRKVYAKRNGQWTLIDFKDIYINEDFILCEPDGTPVGHYLAAPHPWLDSNKVGSIQTIEITQ